MNKIVLSIIVLLCHFTYISAQTDVEKAHKMLLEAVKLMDNGKISESIAIIDDCIAMDPEEFTYYYEKAYAYMLSKEYEKAIELLETNENYKNVGYETYTLWGSAYDYIGQPEKAIEIYDLGISKFPDKGHLYLERGVVFEMQKKYNEAIISYTNGIKVEPDYPSNYYRAANLFFRTSDKSPGLVYGEIFMNLERNTKRTNIMSELLYNMYNKMVQFDQDGWKKVDVCNEVNVYMKDDNQYEFSICKIYVEQLVLGLNKNHYKEINLENLAQMKNNLGPYSEEEKYKNYPKVLFDYHKKLKEANMLNAYNHYIYQMGNPSEFNNWKQKNQQEFNDFIEWYSKKENYLQINEHNYYIFTD